MNKESNLGEPDVANAALGEETIRQLWQESYMEALRDVGICIGNSDVAHMNHPVFFARAIQKALSSSQSSAQQSWQSIDADNPYKIVTDAKTQSIIERGYKTAGYILHKGDELSLSYGQAVRWISCDEFFKIMHCIEPTVINDPSEKR